MSNPRTLAAFIRQARAELDISQRELARRAGVDPVVVNKVERGSVHPQGRIRAESLSAILLGLGMREGSADYARAFALWTAEQHGRANRATGLNKNIVEAKFEAAAASEDAERERLKRACDEAIDQIPQELWPEMLTALKNHRALRLWIESATALTKRQ